MQHGGIDSARILIVNERVRRAILAPERRAVVARRQLTQKSGREDERRAGKKEARDLRVLTPFVVCADMGLARQTLLIRRG